MVRFEQKQNNMMKLQRGDKVAIVATARKVSPDEVMPAVRLLESWGLQVVLPDGLFDSDNQMAGDDSHRAAMLQTVLDDPTVGAIFCARGGYGTVRIVDSIDFGGLAKHPKWIVGYSDITVLHSHIARHCHVPTLHATMPIDVPSDALHQSYPSTESLRRMLFDGSEHYEFGLAGADVVNRPGRCRASVVGGNLSILYSLLASPSDVDTNGKILLIEDLDEYLYHIDRMMMALKRAGRLSRLKGLLVGAMTSMHDNDVPFGRSAERIVADAVAEYDYPVAFGCRFGHIGTDNLALPLGVEITMDVSADGAVVDI